MGPEYRRDIDGLRAIAVVAVVLCHLGVPLAAGGYVGVDVFFVISGYLITRILVAEPAAPMSLAEFYERRVRRIIPALFAVLLCCSVVAWQILWPDDFTLYLKTLAGALLFGSNVVFWEHAGYFDPAATLSPLLHTWSLAVEEQFYIAYPFLVRALSGASRRTQGSAIAAIMAVSFATSVATIPEDPAAAFYLAPLRIWELLIGCALGLGFVPVSGRPMVKDATAMLGLCLVIGCILVMDERTIFPGVGALLPCVGAALMIHGGAGTRVARWLGTKPLVFLGLISYSLYLWHWPLIVFYKRLALAPPTGTAMALIALVALVLATLSWRFVERPFRRRRAGDSPANGFLALGVAASSALLFCAVGIAQHGWAYRFPDSEQYEIGQRERWDLDRCRAPGWTGHVCRLGTGAGDRVLLWGDSHAGSLAPAFEALGRSHGVGVWLSAFAACPPLLTRPDLHQVLEAKCIDHNRKTLDLIEPGATVVLSARWTTYIGVRDSARQDSERAGVGRYVRALEAALHETIAAIRARGGRPVLVDQAPEYAWSVPELFKLGAHRASVSRGEDMRAVRVSTLLAQLREATGVATIDLASRLCDARACPGVRNGRILFWDSNHLNLAGAEFVMPLFAPLFGEAQGTLAGDTARLKLPKTVEN